jgi:uncharacterized membrane protein required for colicin V production
VISLLDFALLLLALAGVFAGMRIGAVSAFFNFLGGVLGTWAAAHSYLPLAASFSLSPSFAYSLAFMPVAGFLIAAGIYLSQAWDRFFLGISDRVLGGLMGMALSLTAATSILFPLMLTRAPSHQDLFQRSAFAPYLMRSNQKCLRLIPGPQWKKIEPLLESEQLRRVRELLEG